MVLSHMQTSSCGKQDSYLVVLVVYRQVHALGPQVFDHSTVVLQVVKWSKSKLCQSSSTFAQPGYNLTSCNSFPRHQSRRKDHEMSRSSWSWKLNAIWISFWNSSLVGIEQLTSSDFWRSVCEAELIKKKG